MTERSRRPVSEVIPEGELRASLIAIRDRLAEETDDATWAQHKRECECTCGLGDGRVLVALSKELRAVLDAIEALPQAEEVSRLDRIAAGRADEVADRRARRLAVADVPQ